MNRRSLCSILLIVAVTSIGSLAVACSCTTSPTPAEEFANHDAVFTGRVLSLHTVDIDYIAVQIQVYNVWKGPTNPLIIVKTAPSGAMCGVTFHVGEQYLVYADTVDAGMVSTHLCTRTGVMMFSQEDLSYLGTPTTVAAGNTGWGILKKSYR